MFLSRLFGTKSDREMKKLSPTIKQINQYYEKLSSNNRETAWHATLTCHRAHRIQDSTAASEPLRPPLLPAPPRRRRGGDRGGRWHRSCSACRQSLLARRDHEQHNRNIGRGARAAARRAAAGHVAVHRPLRLQRRQRRRGPSLEPLLQQ